MSNEPPSRFVAPNKTTTERLSTNTVGLVALSDYRKRRADVLEQQEREIRETLLSATSTPGRSLSGTPVGDSSAAESGSGAEQPKKKPKKKKRAKLSFESDEEDGDVVAPKKGASEDKGAGKTAEDNSTEPASPKKPKSNLAANSSVGIVPRTLTKASMRHEAAERERLRREFLQIQDAVRASEIAIPFVFYDGTNTPGGMVRLKKGDHVWVFLDMSRKVGAELAVGGDKLAARKQWARVGVDDLMLVRGTMIIPHHYDFYFFAINKSLGPEGTRIFNYTAEARRPPDADDDNDDNKIGGIVTAASRAEAARRVPDVSTLEGADDDPAMTKVVDRRWYERNKHIYPASLWQEFDPEKDYVSEIRRDLGGNAFFYSKR
ncbi:related to XAP-5 protein [Cephalotrichum gorgonifer]|uniref:Related to XAP-5 protein n=1 Tax=Cephalotrichum gorgonifer TaxID=2041049 RepID=A0AAE8MVK0_9PEZI|nr:related to XAP-5 protein [Cephalotrichum gorgonifer]